VEVAQVLRRSVARGFLDSADAQGAHGRLLELPVQLFGYEPFAARAWELRDSMTLYDAWYVALAEGLDLPLATCDQRLGRAHGARCEFLLPP
jgi:predicted nucleic acid-binding protein